ncbi:MAG: hypothetical protein AAF581_05115 [Planctomycetota bacterium]
MARTSSHNLTVLCFAVSTFLTGFSGGAWAQGGPGVVGNRQIDGIATRPGSAPGTHAVHVLWSAGTGPATATADWSTLIEVRVNGTTAASVTATAIALGAIDCNLPVGGCSSSACGSWSTGALTVDGFCRPSSAATGGCECGALFITELPPVPLVPGDEIMVILLPAPGALPDSNTTDDTWVQTFSKTIAGPNRSIQSVELQPSPTGGTNIHVSYHVESGPSSTTLDLSTGIQVLLNGTVISDTTHTLGKNPDFGSCENNACENQQGCALYLSPASPPIGGACLGSKTQQTCACTVAFATDVPAAPLTPTDEIMVILYPAAGAWPDLPALPADDVSVAPTQGNRRIAAIASQPAATAGSEVVCVIWEINAKQSTVPQDFSTRLDLVVNGVPVASALQTAIALQATDCALSGGCTQGICGSWDNGLAISDGFCRDISGPASPPECMCGHWFTTDFPPVPLQPGDEIMIILYPAPGALPDGVEHDDTWAQVHAGPIAGPNRSFSSVQVTPSSAAPGTSDVHIEYRVEAGPSVLALDLSTEVEIQVNGVVVHNSTRTISKNPDLGSCDNNACLNMIGCAIFDCPPTIGVAGQCFFSQTQQNCVCATLLSLDVGAIPLDPNDDLVVILRPVPGALPELPGFPPDDEGMPDPTAPNFDRGDCNADANFDIGDPVTLLSELFGGQTPGPCADACDMNDDGTKNIADAVYALNALFNAGAAPPSPHDACGVDPTNDPLDCASYAPCP